MKLLFLIFISILPIFLLGYYIYNKDTVPEPKLFIVKLFFCGVLAFFLATGVGHFFNMTLSFDVISMLLYIFILQYILSSFNIFGKVKFIEISIKYNIIIKNI